MAMTLECALHCTYLGQENVLVRHYHSPTATSMPSVADFCTELAAGAENHLAALLSDSYFFNDFTIREAVLGAVGEQYTPPSWPFQAEINLTGCPSFICSYTIFTGQTYTKPKHGSARISGQPVQYLEANQWATDYYEDMVVNWQAYFEIAPVTGGGAGAWVPVIFSRTLSTFNLISNISTYRNIGHQVSRHIGHGV